MATLFKEFIEAVADNNGHCPFMVVETEHIEEDICDPYYCKADVYVTCKGCEEDVQCDGDMFDIEDNGVERDCNGSVLEEDYEVHQGCGYYSTAGTRECNKVDCPLLQGHGVDYG